MRHQGQHGLVGKRRVPLLLIETLNLSQGCMKRIFMQRQLALEDYIIEILTNPPPYWAIQTGLHVSRTARTEYRPQRPGDLHDPADDGGLNDTSCQTYVPRANHGFHGHTYSIILNNSPFAPVVMVAVLALKPE